MTDENSLKVKILKDLKPLIVNMVSNICSEDNQHLGDYCWPFIPYVGPKYQSVNTKILIVGKATNGWGGGNKNCPRLYENKYEGKLNEIIKLIEQQDFFQNLSDETDCFIKKRIIPYFEGNEGYYSLFWQRIYRLTLALFNNEPELPEYAKSKQSSNCFESIAWTNIFKISSYEGNPKSQLITIIEDKCAEALKKEIEILRPHVILFSTGKSYDYYLKKFLCISDSDIDIKKEITNIKIKGFDGIAFRTKHFQALSNSKLEEFYKTLIEAIKDRFKSYPPNDFP